MKYELGIFGLVLLAFAEIGLCADEPKLVHWRLIVVDTSASMESRLGEVRNELLAELQRQPVSKQFPITFQTFAFTPHAAQYFDDQDRAIAYVKGLVKADGGTAIGPALSAASSAIRQRGDASSLVLMLFTDDEDTDRNSIASAEAELSKLLGERSDRGLPQTLVLRRWSGHGRLGQLATELQKNPRITVIDTTSLLKGFPLGVLPTLKILEQTLTADGNLRVRFRVDLAPSDPPQALDPTIVVIHTANLTSSLPAAWEMTLGDRHKEFETVIPLSAAQQRAEQIAFRLLFSLKPVTPEAEPKPFLLRNSLEQALSFTLRRQCEFSATLRPTGKARWDPNIPSRVIFECELQTELTGLGLAPPPAPIVLSWDVGPDAARVTGESTLEMRSLAPRSALIELSIPVSDAELRAGRPSRRLGLEVNLVSAPSNYVFAIRKKTISSATLPDFPVATTRVDVKANSPAPAIWAERSGMALCSVDLDVSVSGLLPTSAFVISGPVSKLRISPPQIKSGSNRVNLLFLTPLDANKANNTIVFAIQPPAASGSIRPTCTEKVAITLPTPEKPQLSAEQREIQLVAWPNDKKSVAMIRLGVSGPVTATYASQIRAALATKGNGGTERHPLFASIPFTIELQNADRRSYFFNETLMSRILVQSADADSVLKPTHIDVKITQVAPFLVHLAIAFSIAAILLIAVLVCRVARLVLRGNRQTLSTHV